MREAWSILFEDLSRLQKKALGVARVQLVGIHHLKLGDVFILLSKTSKTKSPCNGPILLFFCDLQQSPNNPWSIFSNENEVPP